MARTLAKRRIDGQILTLSSPEKVYFPDSGITKGEIVGYYERIAADMLPYLAGRPLTLHRFPVGTSGRNFLQKEAPAYFPDWIPRAEVESEEGTLPMVLCNNTATLVYLANQGTIAFHPWLSNASQPYHPDRLIFDFDPSDDDFEKVRAGARLARDFLISLELPSFLMTTGSRGLHVIVPLDGRANYEEVHSFALNCAKALAQQAPNLLTVEQRKEKRGERVLVDYMRNAYAQTAIAPFSVRAKAGAPVATPLAWEELEDPALRANTYTLKTVFEHLETSRAAWTALKTTQCNISKAPQRLAELQPPKTRKRLNA